jgi:hypothetical protein
MARIASDLGGREGTTPAPSRNTVIILQEFRCAGVRREKGPIQFGATGHLNE